MKAHTDHIPGFSKRPVKPFIKTTIATCLRPLLQQRGRAGTQLHGEPVQADERNNQKKEEDVFKLCPDGGQQLWALSKGRQTFQHSSPLHRLQCAAGPTKLLSLGHGTRRVPGMLVVLKRPGKFLHLPSPSLTASFRYPVLIRLCLCESMSDQVAWANQLFPQGLPTGHHSLPMVPRLTWLDHWGGPEEIEASSSALPPSLPPLSQPPKG